MPKTKAQPTAFEVSPSELGAMVEFRGMMTESEGGMPEGETKAIYLSIVIPRYGCVTVAEELAWIDMIQKFEGTLQIELDVHTCLLLLKSRCDGFEDLKPKDLNEWGLPLVSEIAKFFLAERREHKPQFSEEPKEDNDSPKAGGSTAPD